MFECTRNLLNRLDVTYERVCMATTKDKYFEKVLDNLVNHNDRHNSPLSNEKLRQEVIEVIAETEEEERNAQNNANNVTMDTFCQSPITINTQRKNEKVSNERLISSDILAETIKGFQGLMIQSTIKDYSYYNSEENVAESDPKSYPLVTTHTSDRNKRKITDTDTTKGNSP